MTMKKLYDSLDEVTKEAHRTIPMLANDELMEMEWTDDESGLAELMERIRARRAALDEFSLKRIEGYAWDHDTIQAIFDHAGVPLHTPGEQGVLDLGESEA